MSDYANQLDEDDNVYIKLSLSKYPFLKNMKVGSTGTASFKGEITSSETNDGEPIHQVTFSDLTNKRESVRV